MDDYRVCPVAVDLVVDVPIVQSQQVSQVVDMPGVVQRQVPVWFRVQKTVEASQLQYFFHAVNGPFVQVIDKGSRCCVHAATVPAVAGTAGR